MVLYSTVSRMRGEATRWARHIGEKTGFFDNAVGVCHGFNRIRVAKDGTEKQDPLVAIIRLNIAYLTPTVLSHELAHAAQHMYGLDLLGDDHEAANHFHSGNEDFAYLYGELFNAAWGVLENAVIKQ